MEGGTLLSYTSGSDLRSRYGNLKGLDTWFIWEKKYLTGQTPQDCHFLFVCLFFSLFCEPEEEGSGTVGVLTCMRTPLCPFLGFT